MFSTNIPGPKFTPTSGYQVLMHGTAEWIQSSQNMSVVRTAAASLPIPMHGGKQFHFSIYMDGGNRGFLFVLIKLHFCLAVHTHA